MDILYVDSNRNTSFVPQFARNAGGRVFRTGSELNAALTGIDNNGGENGMLLPLVSPNARFNETFNSFDMRLSKDFQLKERLTAIGEVFNVFNKTNILGVNNANYSGFFNVLAARARSNSSPS